MDPAAVTDVLVARSAQWVKYGMAPVPFATDRNSLVAGAYKPGPSTTGVLPGSVLATATSTSQLPGGGLFGGTTYQNLRIQFIVTPPTGTSPIVFRNCRFEGPAVFTGGAVGLVKLYNAGHCPVEFYDCTFLPQDPHPNLNGLHGHTFKAYRCDISLAQDSFSVFNTADPTGPLLVEVWQCYVHDFAWFSQAEAAALGVSTPSDGTHNDGVQLQGGSGFVFKGNNIQGFDDVDHFNTYYGTNHINAVQMIKPDVGVITGMDVQLNWFDGGAASINVAHDDPRHLGNIGIFKHNLFGRNQRLGDTWAFVRPSDVTFDAGSGATANLFDDTLAEITYRNG
jgi:hypothetical protein